MVWAVGASNPPERGVCAPGLRRAGLPTASSERSERVGLFTGLFTGLFGPGVNVSWLLGR
jgi:hypothetical protein